MNKVHFFTALMVFCWTIAGAATIQQEPKPIRIVLLADEKDHGPPGNGTHDYPLWQTNWARLLSEQGAQQNHVTNIEVTRAWHWPSEDQFRSADVIAAYCYLDWSGERLAQVRKYLDRGGGLVLIHSATWTKPKPSPEVAELTGVGGFELFRHGPVSLDVSMRQHPICSGLPETIILNEDESYWPPTPTMDSIIVLATSIEEKGARGSTPKAAQPMFWCYETGLGRVFGCVPGHNIETFGNPWFRTLLLRGIAWAAGENPSRLDSLAAQENGRN